MAKNRASLGFGDELDAFDPAEWMPQKARNTSSRPAPGATKRIAEASGFRSREVKGEAVGQRIPQRRRRTGRNAQFNLKARPETIEAFCLVADGQGWGLGETLEHAVALLEREYPSPL